MDEDYQDVDFKDAKDTDKHIRGKILYYSTSQVSLSLNVADSKIRYYTTVFDELLNIQISNKQRRYTDKDIQKLKFIIELKSQGMTVKQIQEYTQDVSFDETTGIQIKESNPLSITTLAKALMDEQHKQMTELRKEMMEAMSIQLINQLEVLKLNNDVIKNKIIEQVSITVDEVMDDKLTEVMETQQEIKELHQKNQEDFTKQIIQSQNEMYINLENKTDNSEEINNLKNEIVQLTETVNDKFELMEKETTKRLNEGVTVIKQNMELRKEKQKLIEESQQKKSMWKRLFNK